MKPQALVLAEALCSPALNHRQARLVRLMEQLVFRGMAVQVACRQGGHEPLLFELFGLCATPVPWPEPGIAPAGQEPVLLIVDGAIPHFERLIETQKNPSQRLVLLEPTYAPQGLETLLAEPDVVVCRFADSAPSWGEIDARSVHLPYESFDPDRRPVAWNPDNKAILYAPESSDANLLALSQFVSDIWPTIRELSPQLVLRVPRAFEGLGCPRAPGLEWIDINTRDDFAVHIRLAALAVLPEASPAETEQKHAVMAGYGLPCVMSQSGASGIHSIARYTSARMAAMLVFRLCQDQSFWAEWSHRQQQYAQENLRKQVVYQGFNKELRFGQMDGLFAETGPALTVPIPGLPNNDPVPMTPVQARSKVVVRQLSGSGMLMADSGEGVSHAPGYAFEPQDSIAWMTGYSGLLAVRLAPGKARHCTALTCHFDLGAPPTSRMGDQLVELQINGTFVALWRIPRAGGVARRSVTVTGDFTLGESVLLVGLSASDPAHPKVDGDVFDERQLALSVHQIQFTPA